MTIDKSRSVYIQIADEIKRKIIAKELKNNDLLSPIREQARQYNVTPKTIQNAMKLLEEQNLIRKVQGSGVYISISEIQRVKIINDEAKRLIEQYIDDMRNLGFSYKEAIDKMKEVCDD